MNFGDKLILLRKQKGMSQEQLAMQLGITRQSVSKWESSYTVPELSKIIMLSEMFGVSVDYLVKDYMEEDYKNQPEVLVEQDKSLEEKVDRIARYVEGYSYTSKTRIAGIPLVSIKFSRHLGKGCVAKGIIAIGNVSIGVISIGACSLGVFSLGALTAGLFAMGAAAVGIVAMGAAAIGIISIGTASIGIYSGGVASLGKEVSVGVAAHGRTAIGEKASGTHVLQYYEGMDRQVIEDFIVKNNPKLWRPLVRLFSFLGSVIK